MATIPLGQFGPRRDSALSGVSESLQEGLKTGMAIRDARDKATLLSAQLGEYKSKESERNRKHEHDIHKKMSLKYKMAKPEEKKIFFDQDWVKESSKIIQQHLPEFYDKDKKQVVPLTLEWFPETAQDKLKLKKEGEEAAAVVKANAPASLNNLIALRKFAEMGQFNSMTPEDDAKWAETVEKYDTMIDEKMAQVGTGTPMSDALNPSGSADDWLKAKGFGE